MNEEIIVLTGGVGGAKVVLGLCHTFASRTITAIVNTGDDFRHLGLWISPDVDTLLYTLSGKGDADRGWGRGGETWSFMNTLRSLGGEDWFQLGDGDLALHVERTARMQKGETLSAITQRFACAWGIEATVLPMSDQPVQTWLETSAGPLPFQRYFVEQRCAPKARAIWFDGADKAKPAPNILEKLASPELRAIVIAPSNPYLSIDPILAIPEIRAALENRKAPAVAVSPLIAGDAVKGPTRKLMDEMGVDACPKTIAAHYEGIIDGLLVDIRDADRETPDVTIAYADTLMVSLADRQRVAAAALSLAQTITR